MNRRNAIRNVVLVTAGTALLPSCFRNDKVSTPLKNISITGHQEKMLAELTETILPKTNNFFGAKELKAPEFILTMVDDCLNPEDQKKFTDGLIAFDKLSHDKFGQLFTAYTAKQKRELLTALEAKKDIPEDALQFYATVKRYTIQCFTSSKEFMMDIRKYKMVPGGQFKGCVPLKKV